MSDTTAKPVAEAQHRPDDVRRILMREYTYRMRHAPTASWTSL